MADGRIRALYGHSVPGKLDRTPSTPPERLHHGTSPKALESIRQTACSRWRASTCISPTIAPTHWKSDGASIRSRCVCCVNAADAANTGIAFYVGNEKVWLADRVPWSIHRDRRLKTWG